MPAKQKVKWNFNFLNVSLEMITRKPELPEDFLNVAPQYDMKDRNLTVLLSTITNYVFFIQCTVKLYTVHSSRKHR